MNVLWLRTRTKICCQCGCISINNGTCCEPRHDPVSPKGKLGIFGRGGIGINEHKQIRRLLSRAFLFCKTLNLVSATYSKIREVLSYHFTKGY
jgi:hypothetical protein